jgi:hypothetical protein
MLQSLLASADAQCSWAAELIGQQIERDGVADVEIVDRMAG